jgi:hypothetical protein
MYIAKKITPILLMTLSTGKSVQHLAKVNQKVMPYIGNL